MMEIINEYFILTERFDKYLLFYFNIVILTYIPFILSLMKILFIKKANINNYLFIFVFAYSFMNSFALYNQLVCYSLYLEIFSLLISLFISFILMKKIEYLKK